MGETAAAAVGKAATDGTAAAAGGMAVYPSEELPLINGQMMALWIIRRRPCHYLSRFTCLSLSSVSICLSYYDLDLSFSAVAKLCLLCICCFGSVSLYHCMPFFCVGLRNNSTRYYFFNFRLCLCFYLRLTPCFNSSGAMSDTIRCQRTDHFLRFLFAEHNV